MELTGKDLAWLNGDLGAGPALAMELLLTLSRVNGATHFIDVESAHVDGCLYHGRAGIDFVKTLLEGDAQVVVPTTLNVSSLDLLHPELYKGSSEDAEAAKELMDLHVTLGCQPTWTCAPYQLPQRPGLGTHVAWGESNAIVFANSVLGARTNRYGDFADLACAVTGRAPYSGLHTDEGRKAGIVVDLDESVRHVETDLFYPALGFWVGANTDGSIPLIVGLSPASTEDQLKALGAAAASSGSTAMFHALGVTPEATTLADATQGRDVPHLTVTLDDLSRSRMSLGIRRGRLGAVSVGTPHMSAGELEHLARLVSGRRSNVPFYVNTGRNVVAEIDSTNLDTLDAFGATIVTDTCTYIAPIMGRTEDPIMTNSGKWAYYAPGNLGVEVVFAGLGECVESAVAGQILVSDPFVPT